MLRSFLLDFQFKVLYMVQLLLTRIHHQSALDAILQTVDLELFLNYRLVAQIHFDGLNRNLAGDATHRRNRSFRLRLYYPSCC